MKERISQPLLLSLLTIAVSVALAACTKPAQRNAADAPTPSAGESKIKADSGEQKPETTRDRQPPTLAEAEGALERVYRRAVVLERTPVSFVLGDFNGDGSEDIAIVVRPAREMLAEINSEFANWIVADAKKVLVFDPKKAVQSLPVERDPVKVAPSDTLLAIIHGHGRAGWRDREATQSYLLRNAAGEGLRVIPLKNFPPALKVKERGANSRADIISETLAGKAGFLYWAAGKYAWQEQ